MPKIVVSKDHYNQVRNIEKATGVKIANLSDHNAMLVPDEINGQHGVYKIKRCYRSGLKYIADMELIKPTNSEIESLAYMKGLAKEKKDDGWKINIR